MHAIDEIYSQRNALAIGFAKAAILAGWNAGVGIDRDCEKKGWDKEWEVVLYVDLPNGTQLSWHIAPSEQHLLDGLPKYNGEWDGTYVGKTTNWVKEISLSTPAVLARHPLP